ncbi:MAG: hypothetical protein CBHOC_5446, partial [uncultured Caballeronia sp.]
REVNTGTSRLQEKLAISSIKLWVILSRERGFLAFLSAILRRFPEGVRSVAARMYWDRLDTFEVFGLHMLKP